MIPPPPLKERFDLKPSVLLFLKEILLLQKKEVVG